MKPAQRTVTVYRGDTFQHFVFFTTANGTPIDLTGRTYTAQLRTRPDDPTPLASMATTVSAAAGQVTLTIDPTITSTLIPGRRSWDLQQNQDGVVTTMLAGPADVVADVTR